MLIEVTYGISILGPAGKVMYTQDPAAERQVGIVLSKPYMDSNMSPVAESRHQSREYTLRHHRAR